MRGAFVGGGIGLGVELRLARGSEADDDLADWVAISLRWPMFLAGLDVDRLLASSLRVVGVIAEPPEIVPPVSKLAQMKRQ